MASDGPGKFKEKKNRASKPYDRPKGIIRRVTDSVTGLFSSSWLSGWMAGEEEEEASDPHQSGSSSQVSSQPRLKTMAPPGESFIFAQPVTARRPYRPIYPEEGEIEGNNQHAHGVNVGASTSSGVHMNLATATSVGIPTAASTSENPSPVLMSRRHPIISSTPAPTPQMFTARTKSHLEPRPLPLLTSSTPTGDDGSEFSESSADTGVDASVIPRPDEREYQREILQLDDESLQTLRETLAKSVPSPPTSQPASALPSLEETRKRPREAEPDQTSIRAEGSFSNRSLFSESGDISLNQPQPSALASKRPRFNVSSYGSPVMFDRSVLSDSSFKMSPFYPGKTMFGGASSYRRARLQTRAQTARVQVKPKPSQSSDDGGLSQSARRILECLEQMSTPISDAKRIPTPIPGQRGSFLDASSTYIAAYHRHKPSPRSAGPPVSKSSTPVQVTASENFVVNALVSTASGISSNSTDTTPVASTSTASLKLVETQKSGGGGPSSMNKSDGTVSKDFPSAFSKAVAEATAKFKPTSPVMPSVTSAPSSVDFTSFSQSSASLPMFEFTPKPTEASAAFSSGAKKAGGKVKSKVVSSGRPSKQEDDNDIVEDSKLPSVSLTMSSLPKIDFSSTFRNTPAKLASSSEGFKFASPEVFVGDKIPSEVATSLPVFTFSSPAAVGRGNVNSFDSSCVSSPNVPLVFNSYSSGTAPKLKEVVRKEKNSTIGELREGSILDILKPPKRMSPEKIPKENSSPVAPLFNNIGGKSATLDTSFGTVYDKSPSFGSEQNSYTVNSVTKKTESSPQVFQGLSSFMKSSDEWDCSVCMVRNKQNVEKCVACETLKPGVKSNSESSSLISNASEGPPPPALNNIVGEWGSAFKKSDNEWDCEICMVRNKDTSEKCASCDTPKPGSSSKSELLSQDIKVSECKEEKTNIGFGSMFAKVKGEWECATCLVRNKSDASKCVSCETPKPGAAAVSQAITGNFRFGVNPADSSTSSSFKFGVSDSLTEVKSSNSSSGFKFGLSSAKNTEESNNSKGSGGFKFGVSEEVKSSVLTEGASGKSKENGSVGVSGNSNFSSSFTFGLKPTTEKTQSGDSRKFPEVSFSGNKLTVESKPEVANAIKTGFNFNAGGGSQESPFTFGLKRKPESKEGKNSSSEIKPASEFKSGSVTDILKEKDTMGTFNFGSKTAHVPSKEGSTVKPHSVFNNALSPLQNDGESKSVIPTFGAPKTKEAGPAAPSLLFGSKNVETTTSSSAFTFGGGDASSKVAPSFSFGSTVNKEKSKPASVASFSFGSKRELESEEPPKKLTFGSSAASTLNNNIAAKPSLFTFGSKENNLSTGSGFGPPPTSTPAFGAPAPTCITTPNFQFGHNNNPVPAATAPAPAFGSAAPSAPFSGTAAAFSSSNSTTFAFGQTAKKNVSAGFDFGQVANTANPGFNFGTTGTAAPVFQFGQKDDTASALFKFGSGPGVEGPTFGGDSTFPPTPPSGRVVKKARRRKQ